MKRKDSKIKKVGSTIIVASAILTSANSKAQVENTHIEKDDSNSSKQEINKEKTFPIIKKDSIELETRLKEIAKEPYNGKLAMGAMCYEMAVSLPTEHICPICGSEIVLDYYGYSTLTNIKKIVDKIKAAGYDVDLDCGCKNSISIKEYNTQEDQKVGETNFKLNKKQHIANSVANDYEENKVDLIFKIRFSKNSEYYVVHSNNESEYVCLLTFLQGRNMYIGRQDETHALHDNLIVLKKMTGLGKDMKLYKHYYYVDRKKYKVYCLNEETFIKRLKEDKETDEEIQKEIDNSDEWYNTRYYIDNENHEIK
jgi:hypothetical protein